MKEILFITVVVIIIISLSLHEAIYWQKIMWSLVHRQKQQWTFFLQKWLGFSFRSLWHIVWCARQRWPDHCTLGHILGSQHGTPVEGFISVCLYLHFSRHSAEGCLARKIQAKDRIITEGQNHMQTPDTFSPSFTWGLMLMAWSLFFSFLLAGAISVCLLQTPTPESHCRFPYSELHMHCYF